jgi:hypothetical protein
MAICSAEIKELEKLYESPGGKFPELEKASKEHNPNMPYLLSPVFDKLKDNARFQELAAKMNLPFK